MSTVLEQAQESAAIAAQHADESEAGRRLAAPVVDALKRSQAFRMFVPRCYNGPEVDPLTALDAIITIAAGDGAAGWCTAIASLTSHCAGTLAPDWARVIYSDPDGVTGGAFAPTATARAADGGFSVDGRWSWGSGSQHCTWLTGGALDEQGQFRIMFFEAPQVTIHDTWYSSGLRGTGSHDLEVQGQFVPEGRWLMPVGARPQVDAPISRMPMYTLFAGGVAAVLIGVARHAIDELRALAMVKRPTGSGKTLAEHAMTHQDLGRAEALLRSARAWLMEETAAAWDIVCTGGRVPTDLRVRVRAAATHASVAARQATDLVYDLGGGSSVYSKSPLQRCFRDVHTGSAHIMVTQRNFETFGRERLSLPIDTSML